MSPESMEFLPNDAIGLLLGGLAVQFAAMVVSQLPFHQVQHLLPKRLAAQTPVTSQRLERLLILFPLFSNTRCRSRPLSMPCSAR